MRHVLGITNEFSEALQRKDHDIVNAILLVRISKERFQKLREDGWTSLFSQVSSFCQKHDIDVPNMNDDFVAKRKVTEESSQGIQLQELNNRFNELICLGQIYSSIFSPIEVLALNNQLETYVVDMQSNKEFSNLKRIQVLSKKMVDTKKNIVYPFVYHLIKLVLILSVATTSVERVVYAMKVVKYRLRNRIGDQWMNDCLITYVEKDIF
ncbi:zinc finger MYM-type protein 1-like [Gossypium australe]|uniref:Zinc finger MYM-type protein 1-like n=1 Tax=Gossypium australe TaxID=47621 RepID=A0A5B6U662_9ROSI|nr:zinc finger MYM-type protein 1-like [Gossypium australe]